MSKIILNNHLLGNSPQNLSKFWGLLQNRVSEFYKIHGYGYYDQGKIAVERIVNTDTIAKRYMSSEYTKEQKKKHQEDFFDYLERGKFKNVK